MLLAGRQGYNQNTFIFEQFALDHLLTPNLYQPIRRILVAGRQDHQTAVVDPKFALATDRAVGFGPFASFADRCMSLSDNPSQIKSTFRMSRSAAAGSHAAGTPGHAPGECAGRCVLAQSARQYEGARPYGLCCLHRDPRRNAHCVGQMLSGTDGQSHFEDLDLLPPDMERSIEQAASSITFTRSPDGRFSDWHNAPHRQYAISLSGGQMEVVIGDGTPGGSARATPSCSKTSRDKGTPAGASVGTA